MVGCASLQRAPTHQRGRAEEEEEPWGPRRPDWRGRRWTRTVQSQEEQFGKAAVLSSVAVKQRARAVSLRKCYWVGQEGGA